MCDVLGTTYIVLVYFSQFSIVKIFFRELRRTLINSCSLVVCIISLQMMKPPNDVLFLLSTSSGVQNAKKVVSQGFFGWLNVSQRLCSQDSQGHMHLCVCEWSSQSSGSWNSVHIQVNFVFFYAAVRFRTGHFHVLNFQMLLSKEILSFVLGCNANTVKGEALCDLSS